MDTLGTVECSIHEFYGTRLGQSYGSLKVLYLTKFAVLSAARRCGAGIKLLQVSHWNRIFEKIFFLWKNVYHQTFLLFLCYCSMFRRQGVDIVASQMGVETIYLHVDATNEIATTLYEKAGYSRAKPHEYNDEFTRSLNLHDGATKGRCHYLMFKHVKALPCD